MTSKTLNFTIAVLAFGSLVSACAPAKTSTNGNVAASESLSPQALPTLHQISTHTFSPPYSCKMSYAASALFLSDFSKTRNSPDLLLNGTCGAAPYFEAATAGDDIALISDLGEVDLQTVSAQRALNYQNVVGGDNEFKSDVPAVEGHTYTVLISKSEIRALYVFHVDAMKANGSMRISYAVKSYQVQSTSNESPGFDWSKENK